MSQYKEPPPPYSVQYPEVHQYVPQPACAYPLPPTGFHPAGPPPGNYYGPPPSQVPFPPQGYGATSTTIVVENPDVIVIGACPSCRVGVLEDDFTCLGVFCAIFFFPLGILCCLALREKRCSNCGATFG